MSASNKVLLVGDDQATLKPLEKLVTAKKYAVDSVASGEEALWRFDDDDYDAVFTDLDLRGMSGLELAEEIKARQPATPVVILSQTDSKAMSSRAKNVGAAVWLTSQTQKQMSSGVDSMLKAAATAMAARPTKAKASQSTTIALARVRNVLLFIFAPFIALGYIITFPLVGLGALIWFAANAIQKRRDQQAQPAQARAVAAPPAQGILKTGGMLIAVIVIGILYGIVGPVFGVLLVLYFAFEAWGRLGAKAIKARET